MATTIQLIVLALVCLGSRNALGNNCPDSCDCRETPNSAVEGGVERVADCSRRGLTTVPNFLRFTGHLFDKVLLNDNRITTVSQGAFQGLTVNVIDLSNNAMTALSDRAFEDLGGLRELYLQNCSLTDTPVALETLDNLRKLDLHANKISIIVESGFLPLKKLEWLKLSHNPLHFTTPFNAFSQMHHLNYLALCACGLANFPVDAIKGTTNLKTLLLRDNRISTIAEGNFDTVKKLRHLDLSGNPLSLAMAPKMFKGLASLHELKLSGCVLPRYDPALLEELKELRNLTIRACQIESMPIGAFADFKHLSHLDVGKNIFEWNEEIFNGLEKSLKELNVDGLGLIELPLTLMKKIHRLKVVHLNDNRIKLPEAAFHGLNRDHVIHIQRNGLTNEDISDKVFSHVKTPITIDLQQNNITSLSFIYHEVCKFNGAVVDVSDNPIECDCPTYKMVQKKIFDIHGACAGPGNYTGKILLYSPAMTPETDYFEKVAHADCRGEERSHERYECTCKEWVAYVSPKTCAHSNAVHFKAEVLAVLSIAILQMVAGTVYR